MALLRLSCLACRELLPTIHELANRRANANLPDTPLLQRATANHRDQLLYSTLSLRRRHATMQQLTPTLVVKQMAPPWGSTRNRCKCFVIHVRDLAVAQDAYVRASMHRSLVRCPTPMAHDHQ